MKVALLTGGFPSEDNPSKSIFNLRAARGLQKHVEVKVFQLRFWKPGRHFKKELIYKDVSITVLALPWIPIDWSLLNALNLKLWQWIILALCRKEIRSFDIIHSIGMEAAPLGAYLSKHSGIKHLTQAIGSDILIYLPKKEKFFGLSRWIQYTRCVICNSKFLARHIDNHYEIPTEVAYRGTDLNKYHPGDNNWGDRHNILFLGGFANREGSGFGNDLKGGEFIKKVWSNIEDKVPSEYRLLLGGPASTAEKQMSWRKTLKHPKKVELLGQMNPDEIPELMRKAKIVLIPSRSEGLPNVGVEALASGCLVMGSDVGGIPEIIRDQITGLLLPFGDLQAWTQSVLEVFVESRKFEDIPKLGRRFVEDEFDASNYPKRLIWIYKNDA